MTPVQTLTDQIADRKAKMRAILGPEDEPRELTDDNRTELRAMAEANDADSEHLRLLTAAYDDGAVTTATEQVDADDAFEELRASASLANYFDAALKGRSVVGAEAELAAEMGCGAGEIPLALMEEPRSELRADAPSVAPSSNAGTNLAAVQPLVYAPSIAGMLNISMPTVRPGTHAEPRITTGGSAAFVAEAAGRDSGAVVVGVTTTDPHRITGRLTYREIDRLKIATDTWEPAIRRNLQEVMSDSLNKVLLQASAATNDPSGVISAQTAPADPGSTNIGFDDFIENLVADRLDGIFATMPSQLKLFTNSTVMAEMMTTFRDVASTDLGSISIWDYVSDKVSTLMFNNRMPDAASNISLVLVHRVGRTDLDLAVMPVWGSLSIDDIYSDSASATTHVTLHQFCGDVIFQQPGAYTLAKVKTA